MDDNRRDIPYTALCVVLYLLPGWLLGIWHPTWVILLTIPLYRWWIRHEGAPQQSDAPLIMALAVGIVGVALLSRCVMSAGSAAAQMSGCTWSLGGQGLSVQTPDAKRSVQTIDASGVVDLEIEGESDWIRIESASDDEVDGQIQIVEEVPQRRRKTSSVQVEQQGDKLILRCKGKGHFQGISSCTIGSRQGTVVRLPQSCAEHLGTLSVKGSSGSYELAGLSCDELQVDISSGTFTAQTLAVRDLDVSVSSGNVEFDGSVKGDLSLSVSSGNAELSTSAKPKSVDFEVGSGNGSLLLPKDTGFSAEVSVGSGSFDNAFETSEQGGKLVFGNGEMKLRIDVGSGNMKLGKR